MNIDWTRMGYPQGDGYDGGVALVLGEETGKLYVPDGGRDVPLIFDGGVRVDHITDKTWSRYENGALDEPNIGAAVEMVRAWPEVFAQFRQIMTVFHPLADPTVGEGSIGSSSHADEHRIGTMYGTAYNAHGLAQAFVHEMAHNKLRCLGVFFEEASRLIVNDPDALYVSPIVKTRLRPMTAVFHAQYSFMHVTALDIANIKAADNERDLAIWTLLLARNLPRMEEGFAEITANIELDAEGVLFVESFMNWSREVLDEGAAVLKEHEGVLAAFA